MQTSIEQIAGIRHQVRLAITNAEVYSIEEIIRKVSHRITGTDEISPMVWESCDSFCRKNEDSTKYALEGSIEQMHWIFIWIQQTKAYVSFLEGSAEATGEGHAISKNMNVPIPAYDVALSFAGEDRLAARQLAELLRHKGFHVFYDEYEKSQLWGRDLYVHLSEVYKNKARYCVMFLSQHYSRKLWTNHERKAAQARSFCESQEYILPLRLDDTEVPGVLDTGYIDLRETTIDEVFELLSQKLSEAKGDAKPPAI